MDEGPLLAFGEQPLTGYETTPELTEALIHLSHALLKQEVPRYLEGKTKGTPQSVTGREVTYSRKILKEDGIIDWTQPAKELEREIRAFIEWPKSQTAFGDKDIIITAAKVINVEGQPGEIHTEGKNLVVSCGEQALEILRLKPAGKRDMTAQEFLAGYRHIF